MRPVLMSYDFRNRRTGRSQDQGQRARAASISWADPSRKRYFTFDRLEARRDAEMKKRTFLETRPNDQVGKVFRVEPPWRRCMVCEQLFTPEGSRKHAEIVCHAVPRSAVTRP